MKILLTSHGYPPEGSGGTERYVQKLAEALMARGHEVAVVAGSLQWFHEDRISKSVVRGIPVAHVHRSDPYNDRWDKSFCPTAGALYDRVLSEVKPDLVHVHHWIRLTRDLVELARRRRVPAVVTLHDFWTTCLRLDRVLDDESLCERPLDPAGCVPCVGGARPWTGPGELEKAATLFRDDVRNELRLARRVFVPTEGHGRRVAAALGLDRSLFTTLPNGSIAEVAKGPGKSRKPLGDGFLRLGCWGALYPTKGVHVLLEAIAAMRHKEKVDLHVYGALPGDAYGVKLRKLAEGLRATFHGAYKAQDLAREAFDVVVLPSLAAESYSFALDEAAAFGSAIVAADSGALGERLGRSQTLFPRGDRRALASILDRFVEEPQRLGGAKAKVATVPFSEHVGRLESEYAAAAGEGAPHESEFDDRAHATFEFERSENRLRHALRYESLATFTRELKEDRDRRVVAMESLEAERARLEALRQELERELEALKGRPPGEPIHPSPAHP